MGNQMSYSVSKVVSWASEHNLQCMFHTPNFAGVPELFLIHTGVRVKLNDHLYLSTQTDPLIAGNDFAETSLVKVSKNATGNVYCTELDYSESNPSHHHAEPSDLFAHLTELLEKLSKLGSQFGADLVPISRKRPSNDTDDTAGNDTVDNPPKKRKDNNCDDKHDTEPDDTEPDDSDDGDGEVVPLE